MTKMKSNIITH